MPGTPVTVDDKRGERLRAGFAVVGDVSVLPRGVDCARPVRLGGPPTRADCEEQVRPDPACTGEAGSRMHSGAAGRDSDIRETSARGGSYPGMVRADEGALALVPETP